MKTFAQYNSQIKKAKTVEELKMISFEAFNQDRNLDNVHTGSLCDRVVEACIKKEMQLGL